MAEVADLRRARRIVIVSRSNGFSSATIALSVLVASIIARDAIAIAASLGVCAGATLELTGSFRAARRDAIAPRLLVASQAVALTSLLCLIFRCTVVVSPQAVMSWLGASTRETIQTIYMEPGEADRFVLSSVRIVLGVVAITAALFECGMALFYASSARVFRRLSSSRPPLLNR